MQQHLMEAQIVLEHQILEAIDQLRKRKARPDADRICNFLLRKYSVDARDTIADLHRLIEAEKVIQVDYKGHTSYRNASKWSRLQLYKNRPEGFVKEKLNSSMVSGAVAELVVEEPDYLDQGVPACRLIEQLLDGVSSPTSRRMVEDFLNKEVACGNLARLSNGNYSLVATSDMTTPAAAPDATRRDSTTTSSAATAASFGSGQNGSATRRVGKGTTTASSNGNITAVTTTTATTMAATTTTTMTTTTTTTMTTTTAAAAAAAAVAAAAAAELYEFDEMDNLTTTDSRSNTPRSSRQASPKIDQQQQQQDIKKEECYEIIIGKNDVSGSASPSIEMDCDVDQERDPLDIAESKITAEEVPKESSKCNDVVQPTPNLKRSTKAERKQRLFARTEDPMDIKFEDDPRDSKEELESLKEKREEADRRSSDDREDEENGRSSTNPSPTPSNANAAGFRSARRKRAKKVFDPSDNNLVKRKRGRQPGSHNKNSLMQDTQDSTKVVVKDGPCRQCSLCAKEKQEALVACRDCTVRAHPSCIYSPEELLQKANSNWQCERCKSCTVCCETSDAGPLMTCFNCDEAYHYYCHTPRITIKSNSKWNCNDCLQKQYKTNVSQNVIVINTTRPDTPSNTPVLPPVLSPQVSPARGSDQMEDDCPRDKIDPNIPDASDWTSEQVYQYFARLFPKEAEVFRQQDIDGHSLLLMKRSDVLTGLDLLLGPALKIYRHVLKLQVRRDDSKLYWL